MSSSNANTARGLKAAIHNPHVSESAKTHAADRLEQMGETVPSDFAEKHQTAHTHTTRVLAGYKAALNNPKVSEEAKEHAVQVLEQQPQHGHGRQGREKSPNRVLGGYKAALTNPRVSEEAKEHAADVLKEQEV